MRVYKFYIDKEIKLFAARNRDEAIAMAGTYTKCEYVGLEGEIKRNKGHINKENYRYYQPAKHKSGDCVIRALTKLTDKNWYQIFDELVPIARENQVVLNDDICMTAYLEANGYKWNAVKVARGDKRPTVKSFAKEHPTGKYLLRVAGHVVTCVDGLYYDCWDSGECCLYGWWE